MRFKLAAMVMGIVWVVGMAGTAEGHPVIENALDVVIAKGRIIITARISREELLAVEGGGAGAIAPGQLEKIAQQHAAYVPRHLRVRVDGNDVAFERVELLNVSGQEAGGSSLVPYRIEYRLDTVPLKVQIDQSFLREIPLWAASCVVRIRQENQNSWETALLTAQQTAEFGCEWSAQPTTEPVEKVQNDVKVGATIRAYLSHGIMHILTGYDHMLFISALVLATTRLWDLVKVVTAFTLAHTITLTLAVFQVVTVTEHIVEPMIAMSIIFVAVQNIFWPEQSWGWSRLAIAFAFGLFHGLGFAGGLMEAMAGMPGVALWTALISFSVGVEIAHQMVILPLYGALTAARNLGAEEPRVVLAARARRIGSAGISVAGIYFLVQAIGM